MSSESENSIYTSSECGNSGNEADSKAEEVVSQKEMSEMIEKLKNFNPYMFEPDKEVSSKSSSDESITSSDLFYMTLFWQLHNLFFIFFTKCHT